MWKCFILLIKQLKFRVIVLHIWGCMPNRFPIIHTKIKKKRDFVVESTQPESIRKWTGACEQINYRHNADHWSAAAEVSDG